MFSVIFSTSVPPVLAAVAAAGSVHVEAVRGLPTSMEDVLWLVGAAVVAILVLALADRVVVLARAELKKRREARQTPGSTPLHPVAVRSFGEVFKLNTSKCICERAPKVVFEGATTSNQRKLWLVIQVCPHCDRRFQTYYDVTSVSDSPPLVSPPVTPAPR